MSTYTFGGENDRGDHWFIPINKVSTNAPPEFTTIKTRVAKPVRVVDLQRSFRDGYHRVGMCILDLTADSAIETAFLQLFIEAATTWTPSHGSSWISDHLQTPSTGSPSLMYWFRMPLEFDKIIHKSLFEVDFLGFGTGVTNVGENVIDLLNEEPFSVTFKVNGVLHWKGDNSMTYDIQVLRIDL